MTIELPPFDIVNARLDIVRDPFIFLLYVPLATLNLLAGNPARQQLANERAIRLSSDRT